MSPTSRRPAPASNNCSSGSSLEGRQIAGGDDGGLQKASSEQHQGDHLVTTSLRSEYIAALNSAATPPTDSLNQQLTSS